MRKARYLAVVAVAFGLLLGASSPAAEPETDNPAAAKPDAAKPDAAKPDAAKPDAAKPDAAKSAPAKPKAGKSDGERILGTWVLQSGTRKNDKDEEAKDGDAEGGTRVLLTFEADNRWTAVVDSQGAKQEIGGNYYLDPEQTPKLFDINLVAGTYQLAVFAIYEFAGDDKLRLRFHLDGKQRPADFESPVEGASLYTFVRERKN